MIRKTLLAAIRGSKVSLSHLAALAGLPNSILYRFVRGEGDITLSSADKLAEVLGISVTRKPVELPPARKVGRPKNT